MARNTLIAALNAVPDPMLFIAADGLIELINPATESLFGGWVRGRCYVTALRQPDLLGEIDSVFRGNSPSETRYIQSDQTGETQFRVKVSPIAAADAGQPGVLLHFTDITHLREAEEMRRDFVANVSHELRSPLTAVLGFIETLRGPAKDDAAARDRFLEIMEQQALRMNRLVGDLLSLSRVESEERVRPSDDVDLRDVISGVLNTLRPQAEEQGSALDLVTEPGTYLIRGDRDQLTQVFMNLTENALKYGGKGQAVTVRLETGEGRGSMRGPVVRAEVIDRGEGIDPLHLPRLTERFYRIDSHRSREMGGTGLGLAIVKHIVNRHRGRLRIASEKGKGSTFTVVLPK